MTSHVHLSLLPDSSFFQFTFYVRFSRQIYTKRARWLPWVSIISSSGKLVKYSNHPYSWDVPLQGWGRSTDVLDRDLDFSSSSPDTERLAISKYIDPSTSQDWSMVEELHNPV
ncbi:uncharacterized protein [Asterias amurensis]|uniref:uncharacterized protein n=1 Tax=Asterias amurensis TaxID=7602 RepID=UPI003AB8D40A